MPWNRSTGDAADGGEVTADIHYVLPHCESIHSTAEDTVDAGIPRCGCARGRIDRGESAADVAPDLAECASGVNGVARYCESEYQAIGVRIPGRRRTGD